MCPVCQLLNCLSTFQCIQWNPNNQKRKTIYALGHGYDNTMSSQFLGKGFANGGNDAYLLQIFSFSWPIESILFSCLGPPTRLPRKRDGALFCA